MITPRSKYHRQTPIRRINADQTLYDLIMNLNKDNMDCHYASYLGQKISFSQLKTDADQLAAALHQDGVKSGDTVGVCLLTVPEVAPVLLGINKLGATSYWMDASAKPSDMLAHINTHDLKILIVFEALLPVIAGIIQHTQLEKIIVVNAWFPIGEKLPLDARFVTYRAYLDSASDIDLMPAKYEKDKATVIVQSSGSTGKSKSIIHTDFNFNCAVNLMAYLDLPFYLRKRGLVCPPPWVIYGLVNSIYGGLAFGIEVVYTTSPAEDMVYKHLGQFDYVYGVPVYFRYLYNVMLGLEKSGDEASAAELQRIRNCLDGVNVFISGGDKVAEEELIAWQHMFRVPVINGYGNNEIVGAAIVSPLYANRPGSIGIPGYGILAKTFDIETGKMLPDGEQGELCISADSLFKAYWDQPEETEKIKRLHDGREWVHTGDLAHINEDGFIYLHGRNRRLIIDKLGYKIAPDNIENLIQHFEFVRECVVVAALAGVNNAVPFAFVEFTEAFKNSSKAMQEIQEACAANLKEYECPKMFWEIEKIPHKENGGKQDFLLLEQMAQELFDAK